MVKNHLIIEKYTCEQIDSTRKLTLFLKNNNTYYIYSILYSNSLKQLHKEFLKYVNKSLFNG